MERGRSPVPMGLERNTGMEKSDVDELRELMQSAKQERQHWRSLMKKT